MKKFSNYISGKRNRTIPEGEKKSLRRPAYPVLTFDFIVLDRTRSDDLPVPEGDTPEANIVRSVVCLASRNRSSCC